MGELKWKVIAVLACLVAFIGSVRAQKVVYDDLFMPNIKTQNPSFEFHPMTGDTEIRGILIEKKTGRLWHVRYYGEIKTAVAVPIHFVSESTEGNRIADRAAEFEKRP